MIALTVRQYFLVVNLMAIPPRLWVVLALAQGFLDMSLPARRLVSASAICRNGAPPSSTDMTWKSISKSNLEIDRPLLREEMDKAPPLSRNFATTE
jgi:hypothetical protein